jgi:flagellar biosynthesis protein FlhF
VTFGIAAGEEPAVLAPAKNVYVSRKPETPEDAPDLDLTEEFDRLRVEITSIQERVNRGHRKSGLHASLTSSRQLSPRLLDLKSRLVQHGVDSDLASEWLTALKSSRQVTASPSEEDATALNLAEHLSTRIQVDSSLGWDSSQGKGIMLVGPPGSGKTSALLKLAVEYGIKRGRSVELWTLDPRGRELGHTTQSLTHLLNIRSRSFKAPQALAGALDGMTIQDRMILIDTEGFGAETVDADRDLSVLTSGSAPIDCQLVLSAAWHPSALKRAVNRFEVFQPSRLLFTMLDQASTFGGLLQEPWRTRKPLSFLGDGALGSGTIQPASLTFILNKIDQATEQ